jgi:alkylhydroperoxidase family enzyme
MGPAALVARLKSIREPVQKRRALAAALATGDVDDWVETLAALLRRAVSTDDADAAAAVDCLTHAVAEPSLPYQARQALYEAARGRGHDAVARLFLDASPGSTQVDPSAARERPVKPRGRALTLGERKALARTHARGSLLLLTKDPHPDVVAILLDNPHVTEDDVVRMAAARPGAALALTPIADHPRWSTRYAVRRALVLNPATPLHRAIRLATTLRPADLRELAADSTAPIAIRIHAAELLATARRAGLA